MAGTSPAMTVYASGSFDVARAQHVDADIAPFEIEDPAARRLGQICVIHMMR
jgi:hypothetical protein